MEDMYVCKMKRKKFSKQSFQNKEKYLGFVKIRGSKCPYLGSEIRVGKIIWGLIFLRP